MQMWDIEVKEGRTSFNQKGGFMNKGQLVRILAEETEIPKAKADQIVTTLFGIIAYGVKHNDNVKIKGFGTFMKNKRKARMGRNPRTGNIMKIPAVTVPKFRPSPEFKELL